MATVSEALREYKQKVLEEARKAGVLSPATVEDGKAVKVNPHIPRYPKAERPRLYEQTTNLKSEPNHTTSWVYRGNSCMKTPHKEKRERRNMHIAPIYAQAMERYEVSVEAGREYMREKQLKQMEEKRTKINGEGEASDPKIRSMHEDPPAKLLSKNYKEASFPKSKHEEDIFIYNHTSVWGSWWEDHQWGYKCCKQTVRNSYCGGAIEPAVAATDLNVARNVTSDDAFAPTKKKNVTWRDDLPLKEKFEDMSLIRLRSLMIKFDTYKKRLDHTMKRHLREMTNMINELNALGCTLTEEHKVQAIIQSLPNSWESMKMHLTYNESIKTFEDVTRYLELEDRLASVEVNAKTSDSSSFGFVSKKKRKRFEGEGKEHTRESNKSKPSKKLKLHRVKCYNCQLKGHFARDCVVPKKIMTTPQQNENPL